MKKAYLPMDQDEAVWVDVAHLVELGTETPGLREWATRAGVAPTDALRDFLETMAITESLRAEVKREQAEARAEQARQAAMEAALRKVNAFLCEGEELTLREAIIAMTTSLALLGVTEKTCTWLGGTDLEGAYYRAGCGVFIPMTDDHPEDAFRFCPYCGLKIRVAKKESDD